ncbi:MAG: hypothetical protein L0Z53_06455 [Acidobacteriales bacterium]|nr:hypothetical protein [Terriglobales bacterium]
MNTVRESLVKRLDALTDAQVAALLQVVEAFEQTNGQGEPLEEYDESKDPAIGFISGPTDFARRAEEILSEDIRPKSGWTQKEEE